MGQQFRFYYDMVYSEDQREIYNRVVSAAQSGDKELRFPHLSWMEDKQRLAEFLENLLFDVVNDDPSLFWLYNHFSWRLTALELVLTLYYRYSQEQYLQKLAMVHLELDRIIADLFPNGWQDLSEIRREKLLFDYLTRETIYRYDALNDINKRVLDEAYTDAWTPYGVLIEKKGVCQGIAETFKMLCDRVALPCIVVIGTANGLHAWNMIRIDRRFSWVDCTWNLSEKFNRDFPYMRYEFFNVPDRLMTGHRVPRCRNLPKCTSLRYNPFMMQGFCISSKDEILPQAVKMRLKGMDRFAFLLDFQCNEEINLKDLANSVSRDTGHSVRVSQDNYKNYIGFVFKD